MVGPYIFDKRQRRIKSYGTAVIPHGNLSFQFTISLGRLKWHFISRDILQSTADLHQLKVSPMLMIDVAEVARQNRKRDEKRCRAAWKKWRWVGSLRRLCRPSVLGHCQPTSRLGEVQQQLYIEAAPAVDLLPWLRDNRSPQMCLEDD